MTIYAKLAKVQSELKAPKNQYNNFGKYSYRSAEDILSAAKPLCIANGLILTLTDKIEAVENRVYVSATATVTDIDSGETYSTGAMAREPDDKKGMDASQITGATSSYARKYALNGLFAIDDTKDADTDAYHEQTREPSGQKHEPVCSQCGNVIKARGKWSAEQIADMNFQRFGRVLCADCGSTENKKRLIDDDRNLLKGEAK